jgi:hypothetical protein
MKFNIKNVPSEPDYANLSAVEALRSYNYRAEKWFEKFEKELRKELRDMYRSAETKQLIKEILGEEK